ncbi:hypothetical protein [Trichormus azollae]|uniref:hypothetical protein n=1 Tax=Trichormus azollae TaxID=1164 RepID=UPI00325F966C
MRLIRAIIDNILILETVEGLASAIKTLITDKTMKARVRALGEKISSEDAVARAVEIFHRYTKNSLQVSF